MPVHGVTPILNVSSFDESVEWFEKWGWKKLWDWGEPPSFGAVSSGRAEIFLCREGQGGKGKADHQPQNSFRESATKGMWMSVWVDDVDAAYRQCKENGIDILLEPTDMDWNVREMHIQHPDGLVFRVGRGIEEKETD
jgi:hypothetical protein